MKCLYCGHKGIKQLDGYCCKAHLKLHKNPQRVTIPCRGCGAPQKRTPSTVSVSGFVYCKRCKRPHGEDHPRYKSGSYVDAAGYRMVLVDGKYHKEHRVVWEEANHACLFEQGTIHHVRFDLPHNKLYNDPDNLLLLSNHYHAKLHREFDLGHHDVAYNILWAQAAMQLHYPVEVDRFIEATRESK